MNITVDSILDKLRDTYRSNPGIWIKCVIGTVILFAGDICVDIFLPKNGLGWTMLRTILAVITAIPLFIASYQLAWHQHDMNELQAQEKDELYDPYRFRYSPSQRLRQSLIVGAVLIVIAVITSYTLVYTLSASVIIACLLGIAAYCRLTPDEKYLRDHDIPDPRDVMEDLDKKDEELELQAEKELRREQIEERKKRRKRARQEAGDYDDEDDEEYDDEDDEEELSPREKRKAKRQETTKILFG